MQLYKTILITLLSFLLFACGGSLDGAETSTDSSSSSDSETTTTYNINLSISTSAVSDATPAIVSATVTDENGVVEGQVVEFSSAYGVLNPVSGTALTNAQGIAYIGLTAGATAGAGVVTATSSSGEIATIGFSTAGDASVTGGKSVTVTVVNDQISALVPSEVNAIVTEDGSVVAGELVQFSTTSGLLSPTSGTALTNDQGIASITLTAGTVEGAGTVTATLINGAEGSDNFATAGDESSSTGKNVVVTQITETVDDANPVTVKVTVTENGVNLANEVVSFTSTFGDFNPASGTALTNSSGVAEIVLTAGDTAGAGLVTASLVSGESDTSGFLTSGDSASSSSGVVVKLDSMASVSNASPATITVMVTDNGSGVANEVVNFSSSLGVFDPVSGTALTDSTGKATIKLTAGSVEGAGLVTASISSGEFDSTGFSTDGDAPLVTGNAVSLVISSTSVSDATPATLTAIVTDDSGAVVPGEVVNFGSTLGTLSPLSGTALTNASGVATITLTAGDVAGAGVASATLENSAKASVNFETLGDETDSSLKDIVLSMDVSSITATTPATVTATITDSDGVAVVGEVVEFSSSIGVLNPASGTALTNASGVATITLTAGDVEGAGLLQVSLTSGEVNSIGFTTAGDASASSQKVVSLAMSASNVTDASPATITATVVDGNGDAIVGEVVNFSSSLGVLDPVSGTALTNASGVATIILTAGTETGAGLLSASLSSGELDSIGFTTDGDAPLVTGNAVSLVISSTSLTNVAPATLTATVTDEDGVVVKGQVVNFGSTLGILSPLSGTVLTDNNGEAQITLTAGTVEGAGVATVTLSNGATASVNFETEGDEVIGIYITMSLEDATGASISTINTTTPGKIIAEVHGLESGEQVLVTFATEIGDIPITTAITDSITNKASVDIYAGNDIGAGTITATLRTGEFGEDLIVVGAAGLEIGSTTVGISPLSAGGSTNVTVTIIDTNDNNNLYTEPVVINFSSNCFLDGTAILDEEVTTFGGTAVSSYLAQGCEGTDIITVTANAGTESLSSSVNIVVEEAVVGSIEFVEVSETNMSLEGAGTVERPEYSTVKFKVLDVNGLVAENETVNFSLNTEVGGITLSPVSAQTNQEGIAQVVVNSGTVATPVRVTASVEVGSSTISTQSSLMVISTGIPDQDSFSLSASTLNIEGASREGEESTITVRLADGYNNLAPDDTAVSFIAEGGAIEPSCTTLDGACSVTFISQNPRPSDYRVTILAYAVGEESFPDLDGNGLYDPATENTAFLAGSTVTGEAYDLPEAFLDNDEDGVRDAAEKILDFDDDQSYTVADLDYNGSLCNESSASCAVQKSVHVRGSLVIVLAGSSDEATVTKVTTIDSPISNNDNTVSITGVGIGKATVYIAGPGNQPLPAGSIITFSTTAGSISSTASFTWPNENTNSGRSFSAEIESDGTEVKTGTLYVTIGVDGASTQYDTGIAINLN